MPGAWVNDVLVTRDGLQMFTSQRIETRAAHGTGCTLASAIATGVAQGMPLANAVEWGRLYLLRAIAAAPGLGHGHQPLGHGWPLSE